MVELVPSLLARQTGAQSPRGVVLTSRMSYITTSINKSKEPRHDLRILTGLGEIFQVCRFKFSESSPSLTMLVSLYCVVLLGDLGCEYGYEIENDFSILIFRLHIIT